MRTDNINVDNETVSLILTRTELVLLNNVLNEICNGVKIPAFSTRLGFTREEAKDLLGQINTAINTLDDLSPQRERATWTVHMHDRQDTISKLKRKGMSISAEHEQE